jgi:hypothetical protein
MPANYRKAEKTLITTGALIGATAGWEVDGNTTDNHTLALMAASQTAGTIVVPIPGLVIGDKIEAFHALGQIESGGNAATLDVALRSLTAAAANPTDAAIASMTQVSVTADTALTETNTKKGELTTTVEDGKTYYFLVTGTTAASTDIQLMGLCVHIKRTLHN